MNNQISIPQARTAPIIIGVALLAILSACDDSDDSSTRVAYADPGPPSGTTVVVEDDYVYYPAYGCYYNSYRHNYYYQDDGGWVTRSSPPGGISIEVFMGSPSVQMDFHDSPRNHHAEVARNYPREWHKKQGGKGHDGDTGARGNGEEQDHHDDHR